MNISIDRLSPACGGVVSGLDLKAPMDNATVAQLNQALAQNGLLLFRDADISPSEHVAFTKRFGALDTHVLQNFSLPGQPEILVISNVIENNKPKGAVYGGQYWHSDVSYTKKPSLGSLLLCREMPSIGGDTMWANMYLAYETLSEPMKKFLRALKAIHDYTHAYDTYFANRQERPPLTPEQRSKTPPVEHPVVRTHPVTGKKALYVNPGFTTGFVGLPRDESQSILDLLFRHSTRAEFVYRHKWHVQDLIFWDNRCTMHYAVADYDFSMRRQMHRTTIAGEEPV